MSSGRRSNASIVANPVLVGAVTTLVIVVAVFLAYNANNGLPFVPTTQLKVQIANGANLVKGNEVRSGGFRVGVVEDMKPVLLPSHKVGAELSLKLDKAVGAVPRDTQVVIRSRSALGLKYVELDKGTSSEKIPDGGTLPAGQAKVPVDLDQFYNTFDEPTRRAAQGNLQGFGDALAGRGADLNHTIQAAPELFQRLGSVMGNLSDPQTDLRSFFKELGDTARIVAPVSQANAHLFTTMANTFEAFSRDPEALKATIAKTPATLDAGTQSLRVQRPFLAHTASLSRDLNAAALALRGALPPVNSALKTAIPVQARSSELNQELEQTMTSVENLVKTPTTNGALRGLTATVTTLQPQVRFLGPYVTVCNTWNYFWTLVAEHFSAPDATGGSERAMLNQGDEHLPGGDNVDASGANEFAHGEGNATSDGVPQFLHANWYGEAITPNGQASCSAGQQGYMYGWNPFRDKGVPHDPYRRVLTDHPPYVPLGPTYAMLDKESHGVGLNPAQVPAGQTFTARPGGRGVDVP